MKKRKSAPKKEISDTVAYGSGTHRLFKHHLRSKMSVSVGAVEELDKQASFLVEKIVSAAVGARKTVFKTATMNASCVKAGLGLVLPEDVYARALEAGEKALVKILRQEEKEGSQGDTTPTPTVV